MIIVFVICRAKSRVHCFDDAILELRNGILDSSIELANIVGGSSTEADAEDLAKASRFGDLRPDVVDTRKMNRAELVN